MGMIKVDKQHIHGPQAVHISDFRLNCNSLVYLKKKFMNAIGTFTDQRHGGVYLNYSICLYHLLDIIHVFKKIKI